MSVLVPPVAIDRAAECFRALADPLRLQILNVLHARGELPVNAVVAALDTTSQANVSRHLRVLLEAGLVVRRQSGREAHYDIAGPFISTLCTLICDRIREQVLAEAQAFAAHASSKE